jgi:hypothetical protein
VTPAGERCRADECSDAIAWNRALIRFDDHYRAVAVDPAFFPLALADTLLSRWDA